MRVMATDGNTMGNGYHCLSSSVVAAAVVGKDDKSGGSLFLYGVVVKKIGLCVFLILMFGNEAISPPPSAHFGFYYKKKHKIYFLDRTHTRKNTSKSQIINASNDSQHN